MEAQTKNQGLFGPVRSLGRKSTKRYSPLIIPTANAIKASRLTGGITSV